MEKEIYEYRSVAVRNVVANPEYYLDYPECQRDFVWSLPMQQRLIDSILRGFIIPPVVAVPKSTELGTRYWLVDGQQRMRTIIRFGRGEFATGGRSCWEPQLRPLQPGKTYEQLEPRYQNRFDNYPLQFCFFTRSDGTAPDLTACYRRLNYQIKLSPAERLFSFTSPIRESVMKLCGHSFWDGAYRGPTDRKQVFYVTLMAIELERRGGFSSLGPAVLTGLLAGDTTLTQGCPAGVDARTFKEVERNLAAVGRLYAGADIRSIASMIPIYQSIILLRQDGFMPEESDEGCLTAWWNALRRGLIEETKNATTSGDAMSGLRDGQKQRRFWQAHLSELEGNAGLLRKDHRRKFSELDKLLAWERQEGKCGTCGRKVGSYEVGHHIEAHSRGGKTDPINCMLVHKNCHP